ncbi:MAG: hypothetical protein AAF846_26905 [Chloroflexota bacterium]
MSDKKKEDKVTEEAKPTVITLVLPVDKTKAATVTVRHGDLGHLSSFVYDDFKDICAALNAGMRAFVEVQANPPKDIQSAQPVAKKNSKKKKTSKKKDKAKGKAPYRLQDATGQRRTLSKMLDPFELQEKYYKANPTFKFDSLDEACEVAQILIDAGIEKTMTITYSNGEAVKVLPEQKDKMNAEADEDVPSDTSVVVEISAEDAIADDDLENEARTEAVPATSDTDPANEASGADPVTKPFVVDEKALTVKPTPVIQALTSPELAKEEGVPEYNEFSLATDDEDDSSVSSSPTVETTQASLF